MTNITNGAITFDADELAWWAENYGTVEWAVYIAGMDEIVTHDRQGAGNGNEPEGEPFTAITAAAYLAEMDARFGPGAPWDLGDPLYAVALNYGRPAFGSHKHAFPVEAPHGSVDRPGSCACGAPASGVQAETAVSS